VESLIDFVREVVGLGVLADVHVELSDLVGVHAWSRNLDGTRPVEVVVAQIEGQLLNNLLLQR
jgi:hypothetical protein